MIFASPFLTIKIDETTDVSNKEQVVICFWWVDQSLEAHEEFIGLYSVESTESGMLIAVIHDVLQRLSISVSKLRGQCYGQASVMSSSQGVATKLQQEEPRAVHTHCYGHALNLACGDTIKK